MITLEIIQAAYNELQDLQANFEKKKCDTLVNALFAANAGARLIDYVIMNGLPKQIIIGRKSEEKLVSKLSYFAPVTQTYALEPNQIVFTWELHDTDIDKGIFV